MYLKKTIMVIADIYNANIANEDINPAVIYKKWKWYPTPVDDDWNNI